MTTVGPYRLDALLGRGTAGSVWRAVRPGPVPHVVAVKRARAATGPEGRDRLRREAEILADLDHPHIVRVVDVLDDGDDVAIVMSYARGGSLHDLLAERGRLGPGEVVAVLSRTADALASAHRRGVLHGDVKPANILFTSDGEPLLGDFGVAQHLRPGLAGLEGVAGLRSVEGTTGYVDPELVATGRPGAHSDVYGVGVVAYLGLTGRLPHQGADAREILAAADAGDHPSLLDEPAVPRALAEVVEAALARDPARRPPSADALARALRASVPPGAVALPGTAAALDRAVEEADHLGGPDEAAARGTRTFGPRPPAATVPERRRRPLVTALVVVAVLAAAAAGGMLLRQRLADDQDPGEVDVAAAPSPRGTACPDLEPIDVPPGAQELEADIRGTGCPVQVVWDGQVLSLRLEPTDVEPRTYQLDARRGGRGQLVIGDWDCDGTQTPGYYQPATGIVSYFSDVPEDVGEELSARAQDTGVTDGRAEVVADDGGCDTVEVSPQA